mmetsp:Transcript_26992/g.59022  ORF Transcript_26992/g.59022 Transcript_26992/m.59022 type:complete len:222 (+) Transcript_26992:1036-1701(+)
MRACCTLLQLSAVGSLAPQDAGHCGAPLLAGAGGPARLRILAATGSKEVGLGEVGLHGMPLAVMFACEVGRPVVDEHVVLLVEGGGLVQVLASLAHKEVGNLLGHAHRLWGVGDVHRGGPLKRVLLGVPLRGGDGVLVSLQGAHVRVAALVNAERQHVEEGRELGVSLVGGHGQALHMVLHGNGRLLQRVHHIRRQAAEELGPLRLVRVEQRGGGVLGVKV